MVRRRLRGGRRAWWRQRVKWRRLETDSRHWYKLHRSVMEEQRRDASETGGTAWGAASGGRKRLPHGAPPRRTMSQTVQAPSAGG
jgi:hypothetical protein